MEGSKVPTDGTALERSIVTEGKTIKKNGSFRNLFLKNRLDWSPYDDRRLRSGADLVRPNVEISAAEHLHTF